MCDKMKEIGFTKFFILLEQHGTFELLKILNSSDEPIYHNIFVEKGMNAKTIKKARKILDEQKLISYETIKDDPYRRLYYSLTDKGIRVLEQMEVIETILAQED